MDNIQLNKFFAQYLGWRNEAFGKQEQNEIWYPADDTHIESDKSVLWYTISSMKFHNSYDWLMNVYIKIRKELSDNKNICTSAILSNDASSAAKILYTFIKEYKEEDKKHAISTIHNILLSMAKGHIKFERENISEFAIKLYKKEYKVNTDGISKRYIYKTICNEIVTLMKIGNEIRGGENPLDKLIVSDNFEDRLDNHLTEDFYLDLMKELISKLAVLRTNNIDFQPVNEI